MKPMASVTFNFVQKMSSLKKKWFCQEKGEMSHQPNKSSNIFLEVQKILIWNDPFFSCCCIVAVNIIFWLILYLDLKFYDIVFTTLLIVTCVQLWMEHFSKYLYKNKSDSLGVIQFSPRTSGERTRSLQNMSAFFTSGRILLKETYVKARFFRQSHPGMFCLVTCMGFLLLGFTGRSLSGAVVLYISLMLVMTVPGALIHFSPPDITPCLTDFFYSSHKESCNDIDDEVEPYLPDTTEEVLELLHLAGDLKPSNNEEDEESNDFLMERLSERTSDTAESICSKMSLFPESVIMPSPENSMDLWEFDLPLEEKTELNETESNGLNFRSKHFDGDSSEEEFIKGLDLKETIAKNEKKSETLKNNSSIGTENVTSSVKFLETEKKRKTTIIDKDSSSDSSTDSFELISEEDM